MLSSTEIQKAFLANDSDKFVRLTRSFEDLTDIFNENFLRVENFTDAKINFCRKLLTHPDLRERITQSSDLMTALLDHIPVVAKCDKKGEERLYCLAGKFTFVLAQGWTLTRKQASSVLARFARYISLENQQELVRRLYEQQANLSLVAWEDDGVCKCALDYLARHSPRNLDHLLSALRLTALGAGAKLDFSVAVHEAKSREKDYKALEKGICDIRTGLEKMKRCIKTENYTPACELNAELGFNVKSLSDLVQRMKQESIVRQARMEVFGSDFNKEKVIADELRELQEYAALAQSFGVELLAVEKELLIIIEKKLEATEVERNDIKMKILNTSWLQTCDEQPSASAQSSNCDASLPEEPKKSKEPKKPKKPKEHAKSIALAEKLELEKQEREARNQQKLKEAQEKKEADEREAAQAQRMLEEERQKEEAARIKKEKQVNEAKKAARLKKVALLQERNAKKRAAGQADASTSEIANVLKTPVAAQSVTPLNVGLAKEKAPKLPELVDQLALQIERLNMAYDKSQESGSSSQLNQALDVLASRGLSLRAGLAELHALLKKYETSEQMLDQGSILALITLLASTQFKNYTLAEKVFSRAAKKNMQTEPMCCVMLEAAILYNRSKEVSGLIALMPETFLEKLAIYFASENKAATQYDVVRDALQMRLPQSVVDTPRSGNDSSGIESFGSDLINSSGAPDTSFQEEDGGACLLQASSAESEEVSPVSRQVLDRLAAWFLPSLVDEVFSALKQMSVSEEGKQFRAYLVGGVLRDALLNVKPNDFDIITDLPEDELGKIFGNQLVKTRKPGLYRLQLALHPDVEIQIYSRAFPSGDLVGDAQSRVISANTLYMGQDRQLLDPTGQAIASIEMRVMGCVNQNMQPLLLDPALLLKVITTVGDKGMGLAFDFAAWVVGIGPQHFLYNERTGASLFIAFSSLFTKGLAQQHFDALTRPLFQGAPSPMVTFFGFDLSLIAKDWVSSIFASSAQALMHQDRGPHTDANHHLAVIFFARFSDLWGSGVRFYKDMALSQESGQRALLQDLVSMSCFSYMIASGYFEILFRYFKPYAMGVAAPTPPPSPSVSWCAMFQPLDSQAPVPRVFPAFGQ